MTGKTSASVEGCILCGRCVGRCPSKALSVRPAAGGCRAEVVQERCLGPSCRICERACRDGLLHLDTFSNGQ